MYAIRSYYAGGVALDLVDGDAQRGDGLLEVVRDRGQLRLVAGGHGARPGVVLLGAGVV